MNMWVLRTIRAVGFATLIGMVFAALVAIENEGRAQTIGKPETYGWFLAVAVLPLFMLYPLPAAGRPWTILGRCFGWVAVFTILFDYGVVATESLHWGPFWFTIPILLIIGVAGLPLDGRFLSGDAAAPERRRAPKEKADKGDRARAKELRDKILKGQG